MKHANMSISFFVMFTWFFIFISLIGKKVLKKKNAKVFMLGKAKPQPRALPKLGSCKEKASGSCLGSASHEPLFWPQAFNLHQTNSF
jgi:hypothetical protein